MLRKWIITIVLLALLSSGLPAQAQGGKSPEDIALERIEKVAQSGATKLDLSELELTELPPELWELTNLEILILWGNELSALPPELGQLTNLEVLDLYDNPLTELPPEFGELVSLQVLNVQSNRLTELPPEIGQLTQMTELYLDGNQLTELPPEIGQLTKLEYIDLEGNDLTALPPEIGQLTKLETLGMESNRLTELPAEIGQLIKLTGLDLDANRLAKLPPEIGQLTQLEMLLIRENELTELPPEIGQLTNLEIFIVWGNQLTEVAPEIGQLTNLQLLALNDNELTSIPAEIGQLTDLTELYLSENELTELPPEMCHLEKLETLEVGDNPLPEDYPTDTDELLEYLCVQLENPTEATPTLSFNTVTEIIFRNPVDGRSCPQLTCEVVITFKSGARVIVIETVTGDMVGDSDQWIHVSVDGEDIYIAEGKEEETEGETSSTYIVTGEQSVNGRACPQLSCAVVQKFAPGESLAVLEVVSGDTVTGNDEWLHVAVDGVDVYVPGAFATLSGDSASSDASTAYFERGNGHVVAGNYGQAIAYYAEAVRLNPDYAEAYYNLALSYYMIGDYDSAITAFTEVLRLDEENVYVYFNRSCLYSLQGKDDLSEADLLEYARLMTERGGQVGIEFPCTNSLETGGMNRTGGIAQIEGDLPDCANTKATGLPQAECETLDAVTSSATDGNAKVYYDQGNEHLRAGEFEEAIEAYDEAIRLNPDYELAYYNRGVAHLSLGNYEDALADLDKYISLEPNDPEAFNLRGGIYLEQERYTEALTDLNKALQLDPEYTKAYYNRAYTYLYQDKYDLAFDDFDMVITLDPDNFVEAYLWRGGIYYFEKGEAELALADLNKYIRLAGEDAAPVATEWIEQIEAE